MNEREVWTGGLQLSVGVVQSFIRFQTLFVEARLILDVDTRGILFFQF